MPGLTPPFFQERFTAPNGLPLSSGRLYFYVAGSTTIPKPVYADYDTINPLTQPLVLDASGTAQQYFMESGLYKIVIQDSTGATISTRDQIEGAGGAGGAGGPVTGDHKVMTNSIDSSPDYLVNKIVSSSTIAVDVADAGGHNEQMSYRVLESGLNGYPKGPAGGDLAGTYPDPIVKQLTGVSATMRATSPGFSYPTNPAMTGIGAGYVYINGVSTRAWGAISFAGHIRWSTDNWVSTIEDDSLYPHGTGFGNNWNAYSYIKTGNDYYWVAGDGASMAFFMAKHVPANYNANGTLKATAWTQVGYPYADYSNNRLMPSNVGDMANAGGVTCWVGNSTYIGRTTDFVTFTAQPIAAYTNTGGIATDGYDTWITVLRNSGELYISSGTLGVTWAPLGSIVVNGVTMSSLPTDHGEQWGSILCSYGTWVAAVYDGNPGHISYCYSTDTLHWTTVTNTDIPFFSAASDGVSWYATNPVPSSTNPIYQLLISSIPAHKKLVAEQGLAVAGALNIIDLPGAQFLSTDPYGKIVAGDGSNLGGKVLLDASDVVKGYLLDKIGVIPTNGLTTTVVTQGPGDRKVLLGSTGECRVSADDSDWDYLVNKILAGAGITITVVDAGTAGKKLSINAKGNSWRLTKYLTANYTVLDTDDTLIIRATGVTISMPAPSAAYEGRIITIRCAGGSNSANMSGSIVGSAAVTGLQKLEYMCYNTGSAYFWVQQ